MGKPRLYKSGGDSFEVITKANNNTSRLGDSDCEFGQVEKDDKRKRKENKTAKNGHGSFKSSYGSSYHLA